ncbi:MAG: hypothetical protein IKC65_04765 [Lentisphaeria bacterium]|nr:hypothetical protein [Lentisphaeria bacterium]
MLQKERNFDFRNRIDVVHLAGMNDSAQPCQADEAAIDGSWRIVVPAGADEAIVETGKDLADYFAVSQGIFVHVENAAASKKIVLDLDPSLDLPKGAFELDVTDDVITLSASGTGGIRRGGVYLEDAMSLRGAPVLKKGKLRKEKLISPRIVHSGWGIELFPDSHLNAIMHAGFDAIAVFCKGSNRTNVGTLDFNDLVIRARKYDVEVYLYAYLPSFKHPDDADAVEFFENVYTRLLEKHPGVAGVMLVGESAEFPSKDPATTGKRYQESVIDGIPDTRPAPGWWPCTDYPAFLARIRDAVRKAIPDARIIFNTYNWGWTELDVREKFLKNLPEGITVQVTYDIFSKLNILGQARRVMDYSITAAKPGYYFASECETAAKYNIPLLSTANTAGATWDIGVIPYVPVPQRWIVRFKELDRFRRECNLSAFYDCHHYGWYPSVITELGKAYFNSPQCDLDKELEKIAVRRAGAGAADLLAAWQKWSDAFDYLPATNEDQYGPLRVGASYPLIFQPNITRTLGQKEIAFPADPNAHFGGRIIKTFYHPFENINQLPASLRYPKELEGLLIFLKLWDEGLALYEKALEAAPAAFSELLERELNLGRFIRTALQTCYNTKKWYCLNLKLQTITAAEEGLALLEEIEALAHEEIRNAEETMEYVELDSRLGWEPSMEYVGDKWHLEWKIRQVNSALREIGDYRRMLSLTGNEN